MAISSPLLETSIEGAKGVLINVTGSMDIGLEEVEQAATLVQQAVSGAWMTSVVLFWDLLIVMFIGLPQIQRRLTRGILWIERIAGGVLIIFGSAIALRFLQSVTF